MTGPPPPRRRLPFIAGALLAQGVLAAPAVAAVAFSDPVDHVVGRSTSIEEITTTATGPERTTITLLDSTSEEFGSPAELVLVHLDAAGAPAGTQRIVLPESRAVARQADADGDDALEVVVLRPDAEMITVYQRVGDSLEKGPDSPVAPDADTIAVGDVDGDGDDDAVVANTGFAFLLTSDGAGAFGPPVQVLSSIDIEASYLYGAPELRDLDDDGDLDLIVTAALGLSPPASTFSVPLLNDGTGAFTEADPGRLLGREPGPDLTGDGIPDHVIAGRKTIPGSFGKPASEDYAAWVQVGNAAGRFDAGPKLGDVNTAFVDLVQLDGRGPFEIVLRDFSGPSPGSVSYVASNGDGTFGPQIPLSVRSYDLRFLDLNHDGAVDILTNSGAGGTLSIRFNQPVAAGSLDFGEVPVGAPAEKALVVTNDGAAPLPLGTATLGGAAVADYSVLENGCAGTTLAAGQSCSITVRFRPGDAGGRAAEIAFTGGPEPRRFALAGVGRPAAPAAGAARCRVIPATPEPSDEDRGDVALTAAQLRVNQRIGQAAIRRLNAVEAWLNAGVEGRDLCGGAIGATKLASGIASAGALADLAAPSLPDPRPVVVAKPDDATGAVRLSTAQLRINQRIYQAAIRRADALEARLAGKLTGSDLAAGALTQDKLHPRLRILSATPAAFEPARSRTQVAGARAGDGEVAMSAGQLRINQRIAQAAVRRANALVARLEAGLTGDDFADGSITARNLASGFVRP
jgi:hypothetical protein